MINDKNRLGVTNVHVLGKSKLVFFFSIFEIINVKTKKIPAN